MNVLTCLVFWRLTTTNFPPLFTVRTGKLPLGWIWSDVPRQMAKSASLRWIWCKTNWTKSIKILIMLNSSNLTKWEIICQSQTRLCTSPELQVGQFWLQRLKFFKSQLFSYICTITWHFHTLSDFLPRQGLHGVKYLPNPR